MKTHDGLNRRTVKEIERFLKEEAARARDTIRGVMAERWKGEVGRSSDLMAWATDNLQDEMQVAFVDRLNRQVSQIEEALERLARQDYGLCRDCGEFIGVARLKALPFAQRCRPCQARAEESPQDLADHASPVAVAVEDDWIRRELE